MIELMEDTDLTAVWEEGAAEEEESTDQQMCEAVEALIRVLKSEEMKEFIEEQYQGSILILEG